MAEATAAFQAGSSSNPDTLQGWCPAAESHCAASVFQTDARHWRAFEAKWSPSTVLPRRPPLIERSL